MKKNLSKKNRERISNSLYVRNQPYLATYNSFLTEQKQNLGPFNGQFVYR